MNNFQRMYARLAQLGVVSIIESDQDAAKSEVSGFQPLSLDILYRAGDAVVIALAHNAIQNGDLMADPDMEIAIHAGGAAAPLSYQNDFLGAYHQVYDQFPNLQRVRAKLKRDLTFFLLEWLENAIEQGHRPFFTPNGLT